MAVDPQAYARRAKALLAGFEAMTKNGDPELQDLGREGVAEVKALLGRVGMAGADLGQAHPWLGQLYRMVTTPLLDGQLAWLEGKLNFYKVIS